MPKIWTKDGEEVIPIWYLKEFWVNLIAIIGMVLAHYYTDFVLTPEMTIAILMVINMILRAITGKPITWYPAKRVK